MGDLPVLNAAEDGYLVNGAPAFDRTFLRAQSFHFPEGLAAVHDEVGAYHIDAAGRPIYEKRYLDSYGYYDGIAAVRDERGWFHIRSDGSALHSRRFRWSGNFQGGRCVVLDATGFFHIDPTGADAYEQRYRYAGDFRGGIAVAHGDDGAFHVKTDGTRLNEATYRHAEPFHKGYAVVEDEHGAYHVDRKGRPIHPLRFRHAEPFYNGVALCRGNDGELLRLRDNGYWTRVATALEPIEADEVARLLQRGERIGLFLRHAERYSITPSTPNWGNDVMLTKRGIESAERLGRLLQGNQSLGLQSSPVARCQETCAAIACGAGRDELPIVTDRVLGDPGVYFDGTGAQEGPMKNDFHAFAEDYLNQGVAPGMLPLSPTSEELLGFLSGRMMPNACTVFITHDLFAAVLMHFLGLKSPDRTDWCAYLEGVCLIATDDKPICRRFRWGGVTEC